MDTFSLPRILSLGLFLSTLPPLMAHPTPTFCRVIRDDGRWFFVDPTGRRFISRGVAHVVLDNHTIRNTGYSPYAEAATEKYGTKAAWREAQARRLFSWGFNTLGAWSDPALAQVEVEGQRLYYTLNVDFAEAYAAAVDPDSSGAWLHGRFPDVFDPEFERVCARVAAETCLPHAQDTQMLGWFTDNELRWGPDWRGRTELLTEFLNMPADRPGRRAALALLRSRYASFADFQGVWASPAHSWTEFAALPHITAPYERKEVYLQNQEVEREANTQDPRRAVYIADCEAFLGELAERYFRITTTAVRAVAPGQLVFGARFAYVPATPVIAACARYVDAISYNSYDEDPVKALRRYEAFGLPLMIGEFSFRARDSGLPNTKGAGKLVDTQRERAEHYRRFVQTVLRSPYLVAYHWFQFADEPREGRFDGEDSNYGVVTIGDEVYTELATEMARANALAEIWAREASNSGRP